MTPIDSFRTSPFLAWRSAVAFWSSLALAPARVAQAQAHLALRMMQAAGPRPAVAREAAEPLRAVAPTAMPEPSHPVSHGALAETSATAIAAATAEGVTAAPTAELVEALPAEVGVPPEAVTVAAIEAAAKEARTHAVAVRVEVADLVQAAVEPLLEVAEAGPGRARKPRKG